ncbi:endonuclease/exonuclease/phosphatase family protein [Streptomyces sp. ME19-01-6]|uniref:endonuclease/exonuclease/phosphatase family protein n=1 Tax=Streptomyces sp. ME19-01-6 TaxID=3028686 RepID=UPI0029A45644|nr:endonuclease/exonuclease/phosphatase family protein [Streptomyces sp. ME19-01-6]MDX3229560.1 endonuclease/exonuclease/phosphatase family protein [Streptomyces sp. ME19-01-6]
MRVSLSRVCRVAAVPLLSALLLTGSGTATAAEAPDLPERVSALTWNLCGGYQGCVEWGKPQEKVDWVVKAVEDDPGVAVIMLQEVCLGLHTEPLQERLGDQWQVQFRAAPNTSTPQDPNDLTPCSADTRALPPGDAPSPLLGDDEQGHDQRVQAGGRRDLAGVLVAMKKLPGSELHPVNMTFVQDPQQGAACIKDTGNLLFACSSHFMNKNADPDGTSRVTSGHNFRDQTVHLQAQGYRTIIGGDLNATPDSEPLQPLYDGNFEADVNMKRPTFSGQKLDHILFGDYGWDLLGASVHFAGEMQGMSSIETYFGRKLSDHWMLKGSVTPTA